MDKIKLPKIIAFEGPDCCGKTTQSRLLQKTFKNSIYVHFPRKDHKINEIYTKTINTLYNKDFIEFVKSGNEEAKQKLSNVIKNNIAINGYDKINFLQILRMSCNFEENFFTDFNNIEYTYNDIVLNVDQRDYQKNVSNLYKEIKNGNGIIILDRFNISGECYNLYIPNKIISKYLEPSDESYWDEIRMTMIGYQVDINRQIDSLLNNFDYRVIVFSQSKMLVEKALKDTKRDNDAYDTNNDISKFSKDFYETLIILGSPNLFIDTDYCMNKDINKELFLQNKCFDEITKFVMEM